MFWDTSAFLALVNARDELYSQAVTVSRNLAHEKAHLLTTDAVLTEIANGLSKVGHRPLAQRVVNMVRQSVKLQTAEVVHIDTTLWQRGWQFYCARPDKEWGLTDCLSFVVMQDKGVFESFTADHHFEQAGFIRLLQPGI
ncbi:MAG: PIN domain-containing protein [Caldilineaceae bacterium]|nr:PIN domain-containing protein [Caldilineaceae bacterium]